VTLANGTDYYNQLNNVRRKVMFNGIIYGTGDFLMVVIAVN
jgi:hypothetical protein